MLSVLTEHNAYSNNTQVTQRSQERNKIFSASVVTKWTNNAITCKWKVTQFSSKATPYVMHKLSSYSSKHNKTLVK